MVDYHLNVEYLPAFSHSKKAANDGAQHRAHKGSGGEYGHGQAALVCVEKIRNNTTGVRERTGPESCSKKSKNQQSIDVWSSGGSSVECDKGSIGTEEDYLTTVYFTEGRPPISRCQCLYPQHCLLEGYLQ
jgi:hypothetical protein